MAGFGWNSKRKTAMGGSPASVWRVTCPRSIDTRLATLGGSPYQRRTIVGNLTKVLCGPSATCGTCGGSALRLETTQASALRTEAFAANHGRCPSTTRSPGTPIPSSLQRMAQARLLCFQVGEQNLISPLRRQQNTIGCFQSHSVGHTALSVKETARAAHPTPHNWSFIRVGQKRQSWVGSMRPSQHTCPKMADTSPIKSMQLKLALLLLSCCVALAKYSCFRGWLF